MALREIAEGAYRDVSLALIPVGLESYYEDHWRRMQELCGADWGRDLPPPDPRPAAAPRPAAEPCPAADLPRPAAELRLTR